MTPETVSRSQRYITVAMAFRTPEAGAPRDLTLAYTRLFTGPGQPVAHPYESVYVEGQLMGEAAAQVAERYAEAGLQVSAAGHDLPDHVSIELAFMAYLASQEEHEPERADTWRERQRRFLYEHLARWIPQFCEKIEGSETHPFYCQAAQAARRLIEEDTARLASSDWGPRIADQSEIRSPKSEINRYPNIHLGVDRTLCTLCTLCTDNCQPGALTVDCTSTTLSLAFDPARCNGCRACLRLCPEEAIIIEPGPPLTAPSSTPGSVVATAQRVLCPDCHRPHIAEPWLERLAERLGDGEAARRSLALCPFCKAASGNTIPVRLSQETFTLV